MRERVQRPERRWFRERFFRLDTEIRPWAKGAPGGRGRGGKRRYIVALAGNPNAGKTSIFNALTGQHQHIGNYPGVTVEKKVGYVETDDLQIEFVDLPGTYSLTAYSLEEVVTRDFVVREQPDLIVDVLDSTNLERNLYLLLQFQEFGIPVVGVLNMMDEAEEMGIDVDSEHLGSILGIPFVKTVGHKGRGVRDLVNMVIDFAKGDRTPGERRIDYGRELEGQRQRLLEQLLTDGEFAEHYTLDWLAIKLLEGDADAEVKIRLEHLQATKVLKEASRAREWIRKHFNEDSSVVVGEQRYAYIHGAVRETVQHRTKLQRIDFTEMIDRIALNRYGGIFIFLGVMFLVYQFTFALGNPLSDLIDSGFSILGRLLTSVMRAGLLRNMLVDGIIGGVGGVLVFFPLVMLLFLSLSLLEDSGYMARAAFVMDRFFHLFGLHGRSFIPFMIATGCAVPAVMSARTLVNPRDRIITVLVTPLLMCGAKSPVIAMLAAAFFTEHSALVFWAIWAAGWLIAFLTALVFRKTMFRGEAAPFVMELPPYRMPTIRGAMTHMWERGALYLRKAGTIILAASLVIWFLLTFPSLPRNHSQAPQTTSMDTGISVVPGGDFVNPDLTVNSAQTVLLTGSNTTTLRSERLQHSYAGRIGRALEPALKFAGFDWKIGIALISGTAAKEVIISTMGIVYGVEDVDASQRGNGARPHLREMVAGDSAYSPAMALALMMFVMIYMPCIATLAVVRKELGTWKWSAFLALYTLILAYGLAVVVYQGYILINNLIL
ncbi:MAG: ferrous iron transport protein B [bacterium]